MQFIKKHIFIFTRFLSIYLSVFAISNIIKNQGDMTTNVVTTTLSVIITLLIMMIEAWYKPNVNE